MPSASDEAAGLSRLEGGGPAASPSSLGSRGLTEGRGEANAFRCGHGRGGGGEQDAVSAPIGRRAGLGRDNAFVGMRPPYVDVVNPGYDYVDPALIDLHITDVGGTQPSYIYHQLAEYYSPEDHVL